MQWKRLNRLRLRICEKEMSDTIEKLQKELERINREIERINRANVRILEFIRSVEWGGRIESERFLKSIER